MARSPYPVPFYPLGMRGGGNSGLRAYWCVYFFSVCQRRHKTNGPGWVRCAHGHPF